MADQPTRESPPKQRPAAVSPSKDSKEAEEVLREQSKTETEERPYLDTEGGE